MAYKPKDQFFPTSVEGNVRTSGSSLTLGVGELAFVDVSKTTKDGVKILSDFTPLAPTAKLAIRMGEPKDNVSRSEDNKPVSTIPFVLKDVANIYVDAPQRAGILVDDFVIGYNGEDGSELDLDNAENEVIEVCLKGDLMGMIGLPDRKHIARINLTAPIDGTKGVDWTMHEIVEKAFLELKNYKLPGNIAITEYVDVMLVNSENPVTLPGTASTFYNLVVADQGFLSDLGAVQAQYPDLDVKRLSWESGKSTYSVIGTALPADYQPKAEFKLKGCEDCPAGYSELAQGFVYEVVIEDPADLTATVQGLPGAEVGSAVLNDTDGDTNTYSVVTDDELTQAEIDAFFAANDGTLEINLIAKDVADLCASAAPAAISWTEGESCNATTETYRITLKDTDCGESRLAELQGAFPTLTIVEDAGNEKHDVTLTGTSGTANINIDGTDYLATFDTDLATTAANFVSTHGATILSAHGYAVTSEGDVVSFVGDAAVADPTIANASGDLAGSVASAAYSKLCQRTYSTTVNTNLVCEECSPEFRDVFVSEAPDMFEGIGWKKDEKTYSATAKMGIRVRGKEAKIGGNEFLRDDMPFFWGSVEISLAGGFPTYTNESYLAGTNDRFTVKYFSRKADAQNLGGNLRKFEEEAQMHFRGRTRYMGNNYGKMVNGQETRLEPFEQYIVYSVTIAPHKYESNFQQPQNGAFTYHFTLPLGKQEAFETVLNKLAAATGLPQVQAVSK